jgi:hypothetical protein
MKLDLMIEGQEGVSWADWLAVAQACERHGILSRAGRPPLDRGAEVSLRGTPAGATARGAPASWASPAAP